MALAIGLPVILPYGADTQVSGFMEAGEAVNRSENILGSYDVLKSKFDGDEAKVLEVITKNPGVLGCAPAQLEKAGADDIRRAASFASGVDSVFGGARRFLQSTSWWDEGAAKEQKEDAPPATGGVLDEDGELVLPSIVVDGETYLYDFRGAYNGYEHMLLTLESEPVGIWDPETAEFQEVEFVDDDEEE